MGINNLKDLYDKIKEFKNNNLERDTLLLYCILPANFPLKKEQCHMYSFSKNLVMIQLWSR